MDPPVVDWPGSLPTTPAGPPLTYLHASARGVSFNALSLPEHDAINQGATQALTVLIRPLASMTFFSFTFTTATVRGSGCLVPKSHLGIPDKDTSIQ